MSEIAITLSPEDADLFLEFQKHYGTFSTMHTAGVFNIRNGNATLHFNSDKELAKITGDITMYTRTSSKKYTLDMVDSLRKP